MALALQETRTRSVRSRRPLRGAAAVDRAAESGPQLDTVHRFSSALDGRDRETLLSLLSADASWSGSAMRVVLEPLLTREEVVSWLLGFMHSQSARGRHLVDDARVLDPVGPSAAAQPVIASARFTVTAAPHGTVTRITTGTHRLHLRLGGSGWRIHRIETEFDGPF